MADSGYDLYERNLGGAFDTVDADRDGFITAADFMALARRISEEFGVSEGPRRMAISDVYRSWWERLRADCDRDGDGRISRDEFTAAFTSGQGEPLEYYQRQFGPVLEMLIQTADEDGDGFIEQDAYLRLFAAAGVNDPFILAGFQRLDADGDGQISVDEFRVGNGQLLLSQDRQGPGITDLGHA